MRSRSCTLDFQRARLEEPNLFSQPDVLDDPGRWIPPYLRRLLEKYPPLTAPPDPTKSKVWAELLAEPAVPWNPKRPPKIKIRLGLKPGPPKTVTWAQKRRYKTEWGHRKREQLRAEGKLPPRKTKGWTRKQIFYPTMARPQKPKS